MHCCACFPYQACYLWFGSLASYFALSCVHSLALYLWLQMGFITHPPHTPSPSLPTPPLPPFPLNTLFALSSSSPTTETPYLCACDIAQSKCPSSSLLCTSPVDLLCTETGEGLGRDFYKGWGGGVGWVVFSLHCCVFAMVTSSAPAPCRFE